MSVPTRILENGQWVTRYVDPYELRARNRISEQKNRQYQALPKVPCLAVFTKTLVRDSTVKWIIPARIRHRSRNDVLFITSSSVEIKEAHGDYTLDHVSIKADFDSPIRSTGVIGLPRQLTKPDESSLSHKEEQHWQYQFEDYDDIKIEDGRSEIERDEAIIKREIRHAPHAGTAPVCTLPPQILVLALESMRLVFLYATSGTSKCPHIETIQMPIPSASSLSERLGEYLAVDPKSRAIAVGAHEKSFCLYALKTWKVLHKDLEQTSMTSPIKSERTFIVDGIILNMEFLHPPVDHDGQVILLLVISKQGRTRLTWYEWDADTDLHQIESTPKGQLLPTEESLPLLLVPLKVHTSFILVCETRIAVYKNILTGSPTCYFHQIEHQEDPEEPGDSKVASLWVQWARPMRSAPRYLQLAADCVYLCREDGVVHFLEIYHNLDHIIDSTHKAGRLGVNINRAFAVLDIGPHADDVLVVGGDASEGGLWLFRPRELPEHLGVISNWTPLVDSVVVASQPPSDSNEWKRPLLHGDFVGDHQRIFACNGRAKHGALTEIRYGLMAEKRLHTVDIEDISQGAVGIWALQYRQSLNAYVVISQPTRTYLLRIQHDGNLEIPPNTSGWDPDHRTIAADITEDSIIQITETSIQILPILYGDDVKETRYWTNHPVKRPIVTACTTATSWGFLVLLAVQEHAHHQLELSQIHGQTYQNTGFPIELHSVPTCCSLHQKGDSLLAFVGTLEETVQFFRSIEEQTFNLVKCAEYKLLGHFAICESIAFLTVDCNYPSSSVFRLICGLRNGTIQVLLLDLSTNSLQCCEELRIGHTSVGVRTDAMQSGRALVHCEGNILALTFPQGPALTAFATLTPVWLSDPGQSSMQPCHISNFTQMTNYSADGALAGCLICLDGTLLHFARIDSNASPQNVSRRLTLGGTPVRILHSERLRKLVVLSYEVSVLRPLRLDARGYRSRPGKRALQPVVTILDPDTNVAKDDTPVDADGDEGMTDDDAHKDVGRMVLSHRPGEKFLGLVEWFPSLEGLAWHMMVINTVVQNTSRGKTGRLLVYKVIQNRGRPILLSLKKAIDLKASVSTVAPYGEGAAIVYSCGDELCMQSLVLESAPDGENKVKWPPAMTAPLRSPARHITVESPYIYVSTAEDSLQVFTFRDGRLTYQFGDQVARSGIHHIKFAGQPLIVASDVCGSLTGLWQPPNRNMSNAMCTVFEATLPQAIIRIHRIVRRKYSCTSTSTEQNSAMLGTSTNGMVIQIDILSEGIGLLQFIQNMAIRDPKICPTRDTRPKQHLEPSTSNPRFMHIDGDLIQRVLERGAETLLRDMLDRELPSQMSRKHDRMYDYSSVEDRWVRFQELASEVVETHNDDWVGPVIGWLRCLLRSAL